MTRNGRPGSSSTGPPLVRPATARPRPGGAAWPRKPFVLATLGVVAFVVTFGVTRWRGAMAPGSGDAGRFMGPRTEAPPGMVWIPGGGTTMGSDAPGSWPDERPAHRVDVDGFWMDEHEVTNAEFRRFVEATGYVTTAERRLDAEEILRQSPPGTPSPAEDRLAPGSLVFTSPDGPVPLDDYTRWWKWTPGASWQHPEGPGSSADGRDDHPVVHVSWDDAVAYATWAGKRLPTEAEWERAARGGLEGKPYAWGDATPGAGGLWRANIWQGDFPVRNLAADGHPGTAPVKSYSPNGYGLYDMAGNVWEWCADWYRRDLYRTRAGHRPVVNPTGPGPSDGPTRPVTPMRVQRGGSFLCNDDYCSRYRPSARHGCSPDTGMSHVGFRCVMTPQE